MLLFSLSITFHFLGKLKKLHFMSKLPCKNNLTNLTAEIILDQLCSNFELKCDTKLRTCDGEQTVQDFINNVTTNLDIVRHEDYSHGKNTICSIILEKKYLNKKNQQCIISFNDLASRGAFRFYNSVTREIIPFGDNKDLSLGEYGVAL